MNKVIDETCKRLSHYIAAEIEKGIVLNAPKDWKPIVEQLTEQIKEYQKALDKMAISVNAAKRANVIYDQYWKQYMTVSAEKSNSADRAKLRSLLVELGQAFDVFEETQK